MTVLVESRTLANDTIRCLCIVSSNSGLCDYSDRGVKKGIRKYRRIFSSIGQVTNHEAATGAVSR